MDKPAPYDEAVEGSYSPTGLPTTGCCSLYKLGRIDGDNADKEEHLRRYHRDVLGHCCK